MPFFHKNNSPVVSAGGMRHEELEEQTRSMTCLTSAVKIDNVPTSPSPTPELEPYSLLPHPLFPFLLNLPRSDHP